MKKFLPEDKVPCLGISYVFQIFSVFRFSFSKNVKLLGFGLYTHVPFDYNLKLLLYEGKKLIYEDESVQFKATGDEIHRYYLKTAIPSMANIYYSIYILNKVRKSYLL